MASSVTPTAESASSNLNSARKFVLRNKKTKEMIEGSDNEREFETHLLRFENSQSSLDNFILVDVDMCLKGNPLLKRGEKQGTSFNYFDP